MSNHDPLCRRAKIMELLMEGCPECALIERVRADEREEAAKRVAAVEGGYSIPQEMPVGAFIDAMRREMVQAARGKEG